MGQIGANPLAGYIKHERRISGQKRSLLSTDAFVFDIGTHGGSGVGSGCPSPRFLRGVVCIAVSTDGLWVVTGHNRDNDCAVRFWDAATGEADGSALYGRESSALCVAVSPDSRRVVSGSEDCTVRVWGVDSRAEVLGPLCASSGIVYCVAISADGSRIVSGSYDGTFRVWAMATGADLFGSLGCHGHYVCSVAVSPDGQWIASGCNDGDVRLWDIRTGAPAGEPLRGRHDAVLSVAFSSGSQRVVSRESGGVALVWSITTPECIRVVKPGDRLYYSSVDDLAGTGVRSKPASSTLLSMSHSTRSRYVYQGDPTDESIVAVFESEVSPSNWHFDSERQRLWVIFKDTTLGISDFK